MENDLFGSSGDKKMGMFLGLIIGGVVVFVFYKMTMPSNMNQQLFEDVETSGWGCAIYLMYGVVFLFVALIFGAIFSLLGE